MKTKFIALAVCILFAMPCVFHAEEVEIHQGCDEYPDFQPQCVMRSDSIIVYYMGSPNVEFPPADSVWIQSAQNTEEPIIVVSTEPGKPIDISSLKRGFYYLYVQLGECVAADMFFKRHDPIQEGIEIINAKNNALKFFKEGQLFIEHNNHMFNAQGNIIE